ncbi:protein Spindly-A-like [Patiria miniata]|uniref:Protein Spindly n=1 Tax=Patiria miniata TaxID=46514 RepID=A0A914AYM0_PATMI|nr:protein Spindly-A-like [Patiria miniata]XP_038068767.1 protein Spindly-A-like [Patiria miniata]XP_038068768.1 protein Spindly-A-like [Patiria miniata]XP_038068769.1 protein Spindly-A-like [Patiria miniata]
MEETSLERQVQQLKSELAKKDNDVVLAAEIGKQLLEQNQDLEDRLEQLAQDHIKRVEQLEQDKYSLQLKLSAKEQIERSQLGEMESLRETLQGQREACRQGERQEMAHGKEMQKMVGQMEELQTSLERAAMTEEQLRQKIEHQDELLKEARSKLSSMELAPNQNDEQLYCLQHELATVKSDKDNIAMDLKDSKDHCQQLAFTEEVQKQRLQSLQNDIEEKEQQVTSYFNLLEKTREEVSELQVQLDIAKMEATDVNKKGNSLFGEVEDRRKEAENNLISMKVQYESAKEQLNMKKQQVHKMRFQIAALLQMGGGRADTSQRERLEQSLAQSRSEVHMLTEKIKVLEKAKVSEGMGQQYEEYKKLLSESDKPDLVEFLQHKLKTAKADNEEVQKELHTQQLLQIAASDKLMDCERRLYSAETETDRTRAANMKLLVTLDELRLKLNAKENGTTKSKINTSYREKICLKKPNGDKVVSDGELMETQDVTDKNPSEDDITNQSSEATTVAESETPPMDQKQPMSDKVLLESTNEKGDNGRREDYVLGPSNQNRPLIMPATGAPVKKQTKKSVSMCETVSVLDATGRVDLKRSCLKSGEKHNRDEDGENEDDSPGEENSRPRAGHEMGGAGSRGARHGGKKHHKVVHMKSNNAAECKQQ